MNNKKILAVLLGILVLFILLIAISISRLERPSQEYSQQFKKLPYTFDFGTWSNPNPSAVGFDGTFPKMPSEMMVYKVVHPNNINESYVRELAQKHFGMPPDANMTRSPGLGLYWLETSTRLLEFNPKTGSFNIEKIDAIDTRSTTKDDYPSNQDCNIIAVKYLMSCNLYEVDTYLRGIVDNTKSVGAMSLGFGRKIAGYKTMGPGGEILVHIGPGGEVVQVRKSWQELVPYKPYPIKTAKQALKDLHNRKGFLTGLKGKINKITLRYYTSSEKQDYVQPIYYFECSGTEIDFYGVVPAIKNGYIQSREEYWKEIKEKRGTPGK
ncbi:MAG: hypothetical protein OEW48_15515 [Phycisphaerae bacterium]|nr:hypothetical protein [Phycisphaerae bacterium]